MSARAVITYSCLKHKILVHSVNKEFEILIFILVLIKVLMKCDKCEFTIGPRWCRPELATCVIYSVDLLFFC